MIDHSSHTFVLVVCDVRYTVAVNNSKASCSGGPCCLDVTNWHTEPGSNVAVSNCHWDGKDSNQRWVPDVSTGHLTVSSCGLCLTAGSTQLEIDTCGPSNVWILPAIGAAGPIKDKATGKCLQPAKGIDGGKLEIVACSSSEPLQQWIIEVAGASPPPPPPPPPQPPHATEVFESSPDERIYGFGEHQQGNLNNKGLSYDMESCLEYGKSHGGEVCCATPLHMRPHSRVDSLFHLVNSCMWRGCALLMSKASCHNY